MDHTKRQPRKKGWRFAFLSLVLAVAASGLVRSLWLDVYFIPSESMEPLLQGGDRILVSRTGFQSEPVQRGDIVFPKSVTRSRVEENFALFDFELSDADVAAITDLDKGERTGPDPDTFDYIPS